MTDEVYFYILPRSDPSNRRERLPQDAEIEKTICYIVFDGFRRQTPNYVEPNGDDRISVSTRNHAVVEGACVNALLRIA